MSVFVRVMVSVCLGWFGGSLSRWIVPPVGTFPWLFTPSCRCLIRGAVDGIAGRFSPTRPRAAAAAVGRRLRARRSLPNTLQLLLKTSERTQRYTHVHARAQAHSHSYSCTHKHSHTCTQACVHAHT